MQRNLIICELVVLFMFQKINKNYELLLGAYVLGLLCFRMFHVK